jgi:filamin
MEDEFLFIWAIGFSDLDDCNYSIKFIPKEMGVHTVSVKHKDMHIPGSPFGK